MRSYAGEAGDQRRERRRTQLLAATEALVYDEGIEHLTVRGVCQRARLNSRYFYENFSGTDELLLACFDRAVSRTLLVLRQAQPDSGGDVAVRTRVAATTTLQHLIDNPMSTSVMLAGRTNQVLAGRRTTVIDAVVNLLTTQATADLSVESLSPATQLAALTLVGGVLETTCRWLLHEIDASREELIDHLVTAVAGSLATIPVATA